MGALGMREYAQLRGEGRALFMRRLLGLRLALTVVGAVAAVVIATILGYPDRLLLGAAAAGVPVPVSTRARIVTEAG